MKRRRNRINIQIGARLRAIREDRGLAQATVAEKLKILRTSLVNIEYGRQNINLDQLWKLAMIYRVPLGELLSEVGK